MVKRLLIGMRPIAGKGWIVQQGMGGPVPHPKKVAMSLADARANKSRSKKERAAAKVAAEMFLSPGNA